MNEPGAKIRSQRLRRLLHRLIDIYSPSGKEEEVCDYLFTYLKRHGLSVLRQPVAGDRYNLLILPPNKDPLLVLIGHVDTVMAYELEGFGYGEQEDLVTGLGAADMKGGCAAMIEAYLSFVETAGEWPPVALALVVGEEEEGDGAQRLVKEYHFPWALIGEPTDLQPCLSHYGYMEIHFTTRGRRRHASLAHLGQNAIATMLRLVLKLSQYLENQRPEVVYNIRELSSTRAGFAVPDRCDTWLDLHLPPTSPIAEITLEIDEILLCEHQEDPALNCSLRFLTVHSGYELPHKGQVVEALKTTYANHSLNWNPQAFRSHSDANLLWAAGVKPILMGPGQLEKAHAPDEAVSFEQVVKAAQLYLDLLLSLSSRSRPF